MIALNIWLEWDWMLMVSRSGCTRPRLRMSSTWMVKRQWSGIGDVGGRGWAASGPAAQSRQARAEELARGELGHCPGGTLTRLLDQCAGVDLQDFIVAPTKEDSRGIAAAARIERVVAFRVDLRRGRMSAASEACGSFGCGTHQGAHVVGLCDNDHYAV